MLLCAIAPAAAAEPDPKAVQEAKERFREGSRLYTAGDYDGARVAYRQSLTLVPRGSTYSNLGQAEMKLGDVVAALKHFKMAMSSADMGADKKANLRHSLEDAYAATGHIAVTTSPGASLTVDGQAVEGTAPFAEAIDVAAGKHTFEAHLGGESSKFEVEAKPGQASSIVLTIAPAPAAPSPSGPPSAALLGTDSNPTPGNPPAPASDIPQPQPSSYWNTRREVGLVVAGAGVLALGAGAIFSVEASNQGNHARTLAAGLPSHGGCAVTGPPAGCSALQDARDSQKTDTTLSGVFLGVGAAAFVAGAAMFLWPSPAGGGQTAIVPYFSPQGGGLQIQGEL